MIEVVWSISTSWVGVDSRGVELEGILRGINGHGDWSRGSLVEEVILISSGDVVVSIDGGTTVGRIVIAGCSILGSVWVRGLGVDSLVVEDVLVGQDHQTTIASLVSVRGGAVHEVLFG